MTRAQSAVVLAVFGAFLFAQAALGFPGRILGRGVFSGRVMLDGREWAAPHYGVMAVGIILMVIGVAWRRAIGRGAPRP